MKATSAKFVFLVVCQLASYTLAIPYTATSPGGNIVHPICITCIREILQDMTGQGSDGKSVGPFLITRPVWAQAGNLTVHGEPLTEDGVYERCARNEVCAIETIENFMKHQTKDCNKDGHVDCYDFVRIQLHGVNDCHKGLSVDQKERFRQCLAMPSKLTGLVNATKKLLLANSTFSGYCLQCIRDMTKVEDKDPSECRNPNECGMYRMHKSYWDNANSLTLNNEPPTAEDAFQRCATNEECATEVVKHYMKNNRQDCDKDGQITCEDFIRMHASDGCRVQIRYSRKFRKRFHRCFDAP